MPIAKLKDHIGRLKTTTNIEPQVPDERDAVIEKLERELDQERDSASALRNAVDDLLFKNNTLETSYLKQLSDARERQEVAECTLAELQAQLDDVGGSEDILEVLAAARADIERITSESDRLRARLDQRATGLRPTAVVRERIDSKVDINAFSINELLEDAIWAREQARIDKETARNAPAPAVDETPPEDMVCPDLVFPDKFEDDFEDD